MAMRAWRIVRANDDGQTWTILYEPVGDGHEHPGTVAVSIPKVAFEIRAAEHGLKDVDEVIEALLYEPLLTWMYAEGDPDVQVRLEGDAPSARARLLDQIEACRQRYGQVITEPMETSAHARRTSPPADPLRALRESVRIDPVRVAGLRVEIDGLLAAHEGGA
ncbi:hypothetical protein [Spongiactinospora sp. TRM90649]|uniref:hypothetical protein n=1 Tax=Spongiactinospora sp. TRM90649 TaxID=3031114 RepID=UPI0023F7C835|nr:hypothetical protein [Spongiactinospora sp. TRM90649]MDF5756667.1 hypothetical protein [Spongiactinospora sp. TRM90649]